MTLKDIFVCSAIISFVFSVIFGIILMLTVGKKFDKLFKDRISPCDLQIPIQSALLRATFYAACSLSTFYSQRPHQKILYGGYDFKANSTLFDKIISATYLFFGITLFLLSIVFEIFHNLIPFVLKFL